MKVAFKDDSFAFEFVRNLGFSYYGGSDVGEMMATGGRITEGDFESWFTHKLATLPLGLPRKTRKPLTLQAFFVN